MANYMLLCQGPKVLTVFRVLIRPPKADNHDDYCTPNIVYDEIIAKVFFLKLTNSLLYPL